MKAPFSSLRSDYRVIAADPPWQFKSNSAAKPGRNAMGHYPCMSLDDIAALPVRAIAADDAVLFLWITGPFMAIGAHLPIMKAWGFKPSGMGFVWVKLNPKAASLFILKDDLAMGGRVHDPEECRVLSDRQARAQRATRRQRARGHHRPAAAAFPQA